MSTSEFKYFVDTDPAVIGATDTPLGNVGARAVLNNVMHLSDEFAQVRIDWSDAVGLGFSFAAAFTNIPVASFVFPMLLRQSGDTYQFRIRIGGYYTGAGATTATIRAVLSSPASASGALRSWGGALDREFLTTGLTTTSAWTTGASQGSNAWTTMIAMPASVVQTQQFQSVLTVGGNSSAVDVPFGQLTLYVSSSAAATHGVYVSGVYLAEYIGT